MRETMALALESDLRTVIGEVEEVWVRAFKGGTVVRD